MDDFMKSAILLIVLEIFQVIAFGLILNAAVVRNARKIADQAIKGIDITSILAPLYAEGPDGDKRREMWKDFCQRTGAEAFTGGLSMMKAAGGENMPSGSVPAAGLPAIPGMPGWLNSLIQFAPLLGQMGGRRDQGAQGGGGGGGDWHS